MLQNNSSFLKSLALGVLAGYISSILLMLVFSILMTVVDISTGAVKIISLVILIVASFICGFFASKKLQSRAVIIGVTSGLAYYLTLAVISAIVTGGGFTKMFFVKLAIAVVLSIIGGIVGTLKKSQGDIKI